VLADQRLNKLECRLALVNSKLSSCTIYTGSTAAEVWELGGYRPEEELQGSIEHSGGCGQGGLVVRQPLAALHSWAPGGGGPGGRSPGGCPAPHSI
jgi:hypothetical protein